MLGRASLDYRVLVIMANCTEMEVSHTREVNTATVS